MASEIQCNPRGLCSFDYILTGSNGEEAEARYPMMSEHGELIINGIRLAIRKGGLLSGTWRLEENGQVLAEAKKQGLSYSFDIETDLIAYRLERPSFWSGAMRLTGPDTSCLIERVHSFTRRARISGEIGNFSIAAFAFWLTGMLWRRSSQGS